MTEIKKRFLTSKEEIMEFLGIKDAVLSQFLKINIPVIIINGRYYAHAENLDAWFKSLTAKQRPEITVEDAPKS
jgi:hypothetical protein